jgi:hypothetical protein
VLAAVPALQAVKPVLVAYISDGNGRDGSSDTQGLGVHVSAAVAALQTSDASTTSMHFLMLCCTCPIAQHVNQQQLLLLTHVVADQGVHQHRSRKQLLHAEPHL